MICRCPNCGHLFSPTTSDFGHKFVCSICKYSDVLDAEHLARFDLPQQISIVLREADGSLWAGPAVPLILRRGYDLPPLWTDEVGRLTLTKEIFQRAEQDVRSTDIMGDKRNFALVSTVEVQVPSTERGRILSANRCGSGWPILPLEKSLYGNMDSLSEAYFSPPQGRVIQTYATIDLTSGNSSEVELIVKVPRSS